MVVDSYDGSRDGIWRILEDQWNVLALPSAAEAVAHLASGAFYAVIAEAYSGPFSGLDLCTTARQLTPPPICILLTSDASPQLTADARRIGAAVLQKPFRRGELLRLLQSSGEY